MMFGLLLLALALLLVPWLVLFWKREAAGLGIDLSLKPALAVALTLVLLGSLLYLGFGYHQHTSDWLADQSELRPLARSLIDGKMPDGVDDAGISVAALARVMQQEVIRDPTAEGWHALALLFSDLESPELAIKAASKAVEADDNQLHARILLARSLMEEADGMLTEQAEAVIRQVIARYPAHDGAWMLLAMGAMQGRDYDLAVEAWQALLDRHGEGEASRVLQRSLDFALIQQARADFYADIQAEVTAAGPIQPGGTLFVFLRKKSSAGQPLAARRVLANRFPMSVTVTGDDWLQAYPDENAELEVGARYTPAVGGVDQSTYRAENQPFKRGKKPVLLLKLDPLAQ